MEKLVTMVTLSFADVKRRVAEATDKIFDELVELRRDFHRHPELAYEEVRTSHIVAEYLEGLGCDVQRHVAKTGVVAHLRGDLADATSKVVALRADLDALPMPEETSHTFRSTVPAECMLAVMTPIQRCCLAQQKCWQPFASTLRAR